ncbi:Transmembrane 9 superfamily member 1 [Smittium culicis]|uniref:Transmembrane 9 superfamily member n=1 Tax=Smittium culicis TaxID=133412 RepID=A0A1R1Y8L8_9FUNG|nr:Transmembrane 9 superfamily member 1 [Smittium culicis]
MLLSYLYTLSFFAYQIYAFYLPGLAPVNYLVDQKVELQVNALVPAINSRNKINAIVPFGYYDKNFYFCRPKGAKPKQKAGSLGSVLFGDRIYDSSFDIHMKADSKCQLLCESEVPADGINFISNRIRENYRMNWLIDGLAAAQKTKNNLDLSLGFPLGYVENDIVHLNNHYDIELHYHTVNEKYYRVVGVFISPKR